MKPGRELDRLVAEAMRWQRIDDCPLGDSSCPGKYLVPTGKARCCPPFSTEASPAMEAWEWLEKNNPWPSSSLMLGKGELWDETGRKNTYYCVFITNGMWEADEWESPRLAPVSRGESYPHAICLAILMAKEAKKQ